MKNVSSCNPSQLDRDGVVFVFDHGLKVNFLVNCHRRKLFPILCKMPLKLLDSDSESDSELQIKVNDNNYGQTYERSPPITPKSPFSSVVRAHLPNHEKTSVKVKAGQTLREALKKAMAIRKLTPEICDVYSLKTRLRIDWDQDIRTLEGHEIIVEASASPIRTSISHNFVNICFYLIKWCEITSD